MIDDPFEIGVVIAILIQFIWLVWMIVRWIKLEIRLAKLEEEDDDDVEEVEIPPYGPCVDKAFVKWKERNSGHD